VTELDTQAIRSRLEQRRREIETTRERLRREAENMTESELSHVDQHPADTGTETHEQEIGQTTEVMLDEEEQRIAEALRALDDGTYGTCVECGNEIPRERLEARPDAIRCVQHQREYEARLRQRRGPRAAGQA
jgi:RNA polymerase-binding transcription factor DksA